MKINPELAQYGLEIIFKRRKVNQKQNRHLHVRSSLGVCVSIHVCRSDAL